MITGVSSNLDVSEGYNKKKNWRAPYVISVLVTAHLSGDMVKQLQRGLEPNSRLQSKSGVKSSLILIQFKKRENNLW